MGTNRSLAKKRARKAEKRRQRMKTRARARASAASSEKALPRTAQEVFPTPENFLITAEEVADLQQKLVAAGPVSILSLLSLEILFSDDEPDRLWLSVEYPTWLALVSQVPWASDGFASVKQFLDVDALIDAHVGTTQGRLMAQRVHAVGPDLKLQHLLIEATIQHLNVRKLVFRFQARDEASKLFGGLRAEMRAALGFDIDELLAVEQGIESLVTSRGDAWWEQRSAFSERVRASLEGGTGPKLAGEEGRWLSEARASETEQDRIVTTMMMQWCLSTASSVMLATTDAIAAAAGVSAPVARSVLRQFSVRPPQPLIGDSLPDLYEPLELRPIVQVDDDRWLLHLAPPKLAGAIRPNLEKVFKPIAVWERYQSNRASFLENRAVELLRGLSPHANSWLGLKYTFDDGRGPQEFELDGLVLVDGIAFLVEGKAGGVRLAARRGEPKVTVETLKALAVEAHNQALRARRYFEQAGVAEFRVDGQVLRIPRSTLREFILVTATLEILSAFVTTSYDLLQAGLLSPGQLPWAVALPELEIICDLGEGVGQVVHYIRRRLALAAREISAAEELDWFGNYLHEGLYFNDGDYATFDGIRLGDFAAPINAYYEGQHDRRLPQAPRPRQNIPSEISALIRDLEQCGPAGFIEAVSVLLEGNGDARARLDRGIAEAKQKAKAKGFGGSRLKMLDTVVVVSFFNQVPSPGHLEDYVNAAKYEAKARRAVGIAQNVDTPAQIAVAIAEGPFVASAAIERRAAAFFASLKTTEEKAVPRP